MDTKYDDFEAERTDRGAVGDSMPFGCKNGARVKLLHKQDSSKKCCDYCIKDAYIAPEGYPSKGTQYSKARQLTVEEAQRCMLEKEGECWEPDAN